MGQLTETAKATYSSGPTGTPDQPDKAEIIRLFQMIEYMLGSVIDGLVIGNAVAYSTRAALFADLARPADMLGVVYNDSTAAYNGVYVKSGVSGSGSWAITNLALPSTFSADLSAAIANIATLDGLALKYPVGESGGAGTGPLPTVASRLDLLLGFSPTGRPAVSNIPRLIPAGSLAFLVAIDNAARRLAIGAASQSSLDSTNTALADTNTALDVVEAGLPKKAKLQNLFTNGNLSPDGPDFVLFDELLSTNSTFNSRAAGGVVIPLSNTIINGLGCDYAVNVPANATAVGSRGNKLTQNINLKGGGVFVSVLVYNFAGGWDFGATGINTPIATVRYLDGSAATNLGLTTYEAVGSNVRRYYGYIALTADKVASRIELGLDSAPPRTDRFIFTGFWASATSESGLAITDTEYPDWRTKRNYPTVLRDRVTALEASTTIQKFVNALNDDFHSISLCLVGDSITWGDGATGTSPSTPRTGALTDPRNTIDETVSPTWANLLSGYLARAFCQGPVTSPAAGVAEARKMVIGDVCYDNVRFKVQDKYTRGPRPKNIAVRPTGPLLLRNLDLPNTATASDTLVFNFTGDEFRIVFAALNLDPGATFTVEVDGIVVGSSYSHYADPATWGNSQTISVAYGAHTVRIWNNSATQGLRLEAIKINRLMRIRNQGIIGRTTTSWDPGGILFPGINDEDEFVLIMLGTNDRKTAAGQINAGQRIRDNLGAIGTQLKTDGKTLILMTPPRAATANDWPADGTLSFDTQEMAMAVRQAAGDLGVAFIDNHAATSVKRDGSLLSDGLHLNDTGQRAVFNNIITSMGLLGQTPA